MGECWRRKNWIGKDEDKSEQVSGGMDVDEVKLMFGFQHTYAIDNDEKRK